MFRSYLDKEQGLAWWVVLPHLHVNIATPLGWSFLDWAAMGTDLDCNALVSYRAAMSVSDNDDGLMMK